MRRGRGSSSPATGDGGGGRVGVTDRAGGVIFGRGRTCGNEIRQKSRNNFRLRYTERERKEERESTVVGVPGRRVGSHG